MSPTNNDICCPFFDPNKYEGKTHIWNNKLFLQDKVIQFMHVPINMGSVITKMFKQIEDAKAMPNSNEFIMLCHDLSPWQSEIFMTVNKNVPNGHTTTLSGTFLSKVYDGPYHQVPLWIKDMNNYVVNKGKTVQKYYFHYAYCPKCMKKYGHNYCVAFAQVV